MADDPDDFIDETGAYPFHDLTRDGYFRASEPWSKAEEQVLLQLHREQRLSDEGISRHLARPPGSIRYRLRQLLDPDGHGRAAERSRTEHPLRRVLMGRHPVTGKPLSPDSAWRHPAILNDLPVILRACDLADTAPRVQTPPRDSIDRNPPRRRRPRSSFTKPSGTASDDDVIERD
ncbi:hypothetical protein FHS00_001732 [Limimaricola variabilis]|uniref:Uncharacterized protein n=1 Tax=Limimaricola variabilis TaxID=1492771 RepID=A0ABR6HNM7_9RHOB|nr:SANT/Myb-like DNA-binding domain-containing protein [Limimaricola variabilis]MBB3712155.1 hypothetical protein [Limimaricola variabilis]